MKASALLAMATAIVLLQAAGAGPDPDPAAALKCRVVGIQVVGVTGLDPDGWDWEMMPFGEEMGTTLSLAVTSDRPDVVPLAAAVTEFRSFRDSTGADLEAVELDENEAQFWALSGLRPGMPRGLQLVDLQAGRVPAAGSQLVRAEGTLTTVVGLRPASARQEAVALREGSRITAGPVPFEIVEVTFPEAREGVAAKADAPAKNVGELVDDIDWALGLDEPSVIFEDTFPPGIGRGEFYGPPKMVVTIQARQNLERIAAIELFGADGKAVEWSSQGNSYEMTGEEGQPGTVETIGLIIGLPEKLETVDVVVHYYGEVRQIELPFSVECGVAVESIAAP